MADVQIDNGNFTQLANVLLEKVSSAKLNGCQHAIILQVWRYTYGFKRKEHELSAGFLARATGYNQRQIQRDLIVLVERNIIIQRVINGISRTLSFNKNFDKWDVTYGELADGEKAIGELTDGELAVIPTANKTGVTYGELADQERKSFKQIFKENQEEENPIKNAADAYYYSFKKINYTGQIQGYIVELSKRGIKDEFIKEVFLAMGEHGASPDVNYMRKMSEDWISRGISTLAEAKAQREKSKEPTVIQFKQEKKEKEVELYFRPSS